MAKYVKEKHQNWLEEKKKEGKKVKNSEMIIFRIGLKNEKYAASAPATEQCEDNWEFKRI